MGKHKTKKQMKVQHKQKVERRAKIMADQEKDVVGNNGEVVTEPGEKAPEPELVPTPEQLAQIEAGEVEAAKAQYEAEMEQGLEIDTTLEPKPEMIDDGQLPEPTPGAIEAILEAVAPSPEPKPFDPNSVIAKYLKK